MGTMLPLSITLLPQDEYQWLGTNPSPGTFVQGDNVYPLYHQWRTYNAEEPIIVNTHNTGTGKTKAAFLRLLKRAQKTPTLQPTYDDVLFIAPTNELLLQHAEDARTFCDKNKLRYRVLMITKDTLEEHRTRPDFSEEQTHRRGAVLHMLLSDAGKAEENEEYEATIYVVNPDIFYYALYFYYARYDRETLFRDFLGNFNYIIIDEFHYYNPKQFAAFLFFIKLSHHYGYFDNKAKQRQCCILTATPNAQVETYLNRLGLAIAWITPGSVVEADLPYVRSVRALAPVRLFVYNKEERDESGERGLLPLVRQESATITKWLERPGDGAIISGSLGLINRIHELLLPLGIKDIMGRITGAQTRDERQKAKYRQLILATSTVDIGYNFERNPAVDEKKLRQNIDFLFFDAATGDEVVQRVGRAGRVLAVKEQNHLSHVYMVVEPKMYEALQAYNGAELDRGTFSGLARTNMPKRNDLYAYIASGAVIEAAYPLKFLKKGTSDDPKAIEDLDEFLEEIKQLFGVKKKFTYTTEQNRITTFEHQKEAYESLRTIPVTAFDDWVALLKLRSLNKEEIKDEQSRPWIRAFKMRLANATKEIAKGMKPRQVGEWFREDLRKYAIQLARFSFRESFQPPFALIHDPEHSHSEKTIATYNALHIIRYYHLSYMNEEEFTVVTRGETPVSLSENQRKTAVIYCRLQRFRDSPLQLELRLDARECSQASWEANMTHCLTALYGLQLAPTSDHSGFARASYDLLREQFIPAFVVPKEGRWAGTLLTLMREARFFPLEMTVTFADDSTQNYRVVLGSMAFQIYAELEDRYPYAMKQAALKRRIEEDEPYIC